MNLLFLFYGKRNSISSGRLDTEAEVGGVGLEDVVATLIFELLCVAGLLFLLRFLTALYREGKRTPRSPIACVIPLNRRVLGNSSRLVAIAGGAHRRQRYDRPPLTTISGGREQPPRKAG
jgi:hypothetical protein